MARSSGREERHAPVAEGTLSIIAKGTCLTGDVETDGVVKIEGKVIGNIRAARQVLVGKEGHVEGDIQSQEVIVGGRIHGSIQADERVELQASCSVQGDISTRRVLVEEGSQLDGALRMAESARPDETAESGLEPLAQPTPHAQPTPPAQPTPKPRAEFG